MRQELGWYRGDNAPSSQIWDEGVFYCLEDTMTELLYTTDAYVQTFDGVVTAVTEDNGVV